MSHFTRFTRLQPLYPPSTWRLSMCKPTTPKHIPPLRPRTRPFSHYNHPHHHQNNHQKIRRNYIFNRLLTGTVLFTSIFIFVQADYTTGGVTYAMAEKHRSWLASMGVPVPAVLPTQPVSSLLHQYFTLKASDTSPSFSWLGCAFNHPSFLDIFFNALVFSSISPSLCILPRVHCAAVVVGSAVTASLNWLRYHGDSDNGLGAGGGGAAATTTTMGLSGVVSGSIATIAMLAPRAPVTLFGILGPMPMWVMAGGFFMLDAYYMQRGDGRAAMDAGGAVFGVLYYALFLRRFGGVLRLRRW